MRGGSRVLVALVLSVHTALLAWSAKQHSPTFNELGHLPAGISHWRYRRFELYRVNPPLPRMIAAAPVLWMRPQTDWSNYGMSPSAREEIPMGIRFAKANGPRTFRLFTVARWACIPFCLIGACVCYRWARDLWGEAAGLTSLCLWCFNPTVLGHGALVMPDVPAAALGLAASYLFWRWLRKPAWRGAVAAGIALGLACLSKTTLLLLVLIWPVLCLADRRSRGQAFPGDSWYRRSAMLGATILAALYLVNLGYGFRGSLQPLERFRFQSRLLNGLPDGRATSGNRFAGTWLGRLPAPVPADYLQGVDRQRADFEAGDRSYLRGEWKIGGWWYYHLYALAVKTPSGTWLVLLTAVAAAICAKGYRAHLVDELSVLLPAIAILALVSSQTGFSNHMRYTLPALPFLFIWMSRSVHGLKRPGICPWTITVFGVAATVAGSLAVYPHSLSYFNLFAGGPVRGYQHLLDSNFAWGQDLLFLRRWLDEHPEARPLHLAAFGWINPRLAGVEFRLPPLASEQATLTGRDETLARPLQPGWYVLDVNFLQGTHWPAATSKGTWKMIPPDGPSFRYFRRFTPDDRIGYSMNVYHLTAQDINGQ